MLAALDVDSVDKDPKTRLQEFQQSKKGELPVYTIVETRGEAHDQVFKISCTLGQETVFSEAKSKRKAEQQAASLMLLQLQ